MRRLAMYLFVPVLIGLTTLALLAQVSPWPGALILRLAFDHGARQANAELADLLPSDRTEVLNLAYGPHPDERLDLFLPPGPPPPEGWPVLLWVHGGAFVSGRKEDVGNFLRLIAAIAPDYSLAPEALHPTPTAQMLEALLWIKAAARDRPLDPGRIVLAGDSAGGHVALQTAIAIHDPTYAQTLGLRPQTDVGAIHGLALFCGVFDLPTQSDSQAARFLLHTVSWAYLGVPDPADVPSAAGFDLTSRLPPTLPPVFITAGTADPLLPQSETLAEVARQKGIVVDTLFFPADHQPPLGHGYQFGAGEAGNTARQRLLAFLDTVTDR